MPLEDRDQEIAKIVHNAMIRAGLTVADAPFLPTKPEANVESLDPVEGTQPTPEPLVPVLAVETSPPRTLDLSSYLPVVGVVLLSIALVVGITVLEPPRLIDAYDIFSTPLHVIPEWFMLPAFGIVLAAPAKILGLGAMSGVLLILFMLPVLPKFEKLVPQSYWVFRGLFVLLHVGVAALGFASM